MNTELNGERELLRTATTAANALLLAAGLMLLRATVLPYLLCSYLPGYLNYPPDPREQFAAFALVVLFMASSAWAKKEPLAASIMALTLYLGVALPELIQTPWLFPPYVGKAVITLILLRALIAAITHRVLQSETAANRAKETQEPSA